MMRRRGAVPTLSRDALQRRRGERWPLFFILLVLTFLVSASVGKFSISIPDILSTIYYHFTDPAQIENVNMETTLFNIRLPRIFAVILVGGGLSMAGAAYQGMFKNPMVSRTSSAPPRGRPWAHALPCSSAGIPISSSCAAL